MLETYSVSFGVAVRPAGRMYTLSVRVWLAPPTVDVMVAVSTLLGWGMTKLRVLPGTTAMTHRFAADGQPFQVERRKRPASYPSSDPWQVQDCFTCAIDPANDTIVKVSTTAVSRLQRGYEYRVVRRTRGDGSNILRCKLPHLTLATYPAVFDYDPLTFSVCDTIPAHSPGDADDSGIVDQDDVSSVLANWGSTACMKFGDATRDGVVNSADLQEAELYYTWEYCYASGMSAGAGAIETFAIV